MDGTPGLITGLAGTLAGIATAYITRGSSATTTALKAEIDKITAADGRLAKLEESVRVLAKDVTDLRTYVADQIKAIIADNATIHSRLSRRLTGQQPSLPAAEELGRMVGVDDLERRIKGLEDSERDRQNAAAALQRDIGIILGRLEGGGRR